MKWCKLISWKIVHIAQNIKLHAVQNVKKLNLKQSDSKYLKIKDGTVIKQINSNNNAGSLNII